MVAAHVRKGLVPFGDMLCLQHSRPLQPTARGMRHTQQQTQYNLTSGVWGGRCVRSLAPTLYNKEVVFDRASTRVEARDMWRNKTLYWIFFILEACLVGILASSFFRYAFGYHTRFFVAIVIALSLCITCFTCGAICSSRKIYLGSIICWLLLLPVWFAIANHISIFHDKDHILWTPEHLTVVGVVIILHMIYLIVYSQETVYHLSQIQTQTYSFQVYRNHVLTLYGVYFGSLVHLVKVLVLLVRELREP